MTSRQTLATISNLPTRELWKVHRITFPTLAKFTPDALSIPASSDGVERLFNIARNVRHYRRGSLNATRIQELMLYRCLMQFDRNYYHTCTSI